MPDGCVLTNRRARPNEAWVEPYDDRTTIEAETGGKRERERSRLDAKSDDVTGKIAYFLGFLGRLGFAGFLLRM